MGSNRRLAIVLLVILLVMLGAIFALRGIQHAANSPLPSIFHIPEGAERRGMLFGADQSKRLEAAIAYFYASTTLTRRDIVDLLNYAARFPEDDNRQVILRALGGVNMDGEFALVTILCNGGPDNLLDKDVAQQLLLAALAERDPEYQKAVKQVPGAPSPTIDYAALRQTFIDRAVPPGDGQRPQ